MQLQMQDFQEELKLNGFTIIPDVLTTDEVEQSKMMFKNGENN